MDTKNIPPLDGPFVIEFEAWAKVQVETWQQVLHTIAGRYPHFSIGHSLDLGEGGDRTMFWESSDGAADKPAVGCVRRA